MQITNRHIDDKFTISSETDFKREMRKMQADIK